MAEPVEESTSQPPVTIPWPTMAPFGEPILASSVQEMWDSYIKPGQDAGKAQSVDERVLMGILRAVHKGLTSPFADRAVVRDRLGRWLFERDYRERSLASASDATWEEFVERNQEQWREEADALLAALDTIAAGREPEVEEPEVEEP